jgi:hypothetical protein
VRRSAANIRDAAMPVLYGNAGSRRLLLVAAMWFVYWSSGPYDAG